jgi:hypothetical protein
MNKGKIIFYDDDPDFTSQFQQLMEESGFEIIIFNDLDSLRPALSNKDIMHETKCLVFDLAKDKDEAKQTRNFAILEDIAAKFNELRIPIFIHSTYAEDIQNFNNCGTVWKIAKSGTSVATVVDTITKLDESGFIEAFTPSGLIEQSLMQELHKSFTEQFRDGEIEKIINSIKISDPDEFRIRAIQVFKRIAVRSLMSEVQAPLISEKGGVNPIEHYYRRISKVDLWTGDVLKSKGEDSYVLIITPRCNVLRDDSLLVCLIKVGDFPDSIGTKNQEKVGHALTDKPEVSGYNRYLPPSPIFKGGKVLLSNYSMMSRQILSQDFEVIISLSDELTNELLGKFGAYFFRTGITPWNKNEAIAHIDNSKTVNAKK